MPKAFFIDTTRCTACRGCQAACKEWHEFPANKTKQAGWGSHQNPPDLNPYNYKIVRFAEHREKDRVVWNFFPDQCRHCKDSPCKYAADEMREGLIVIDDSTGAVIYPDESKGLSKEDFRKIHEYCPYDIPRYDEKTGGISKCDMCIDRVKKGLVPMCAKTCPTGATNFGEREDMLALAGKRLEIQKKRYPGAQLLNVDDVNVIYLIVDKPQNYHKKLSAMRHSSGAVSRRTAMKEVFRNIFG
jgi:formate dehydrogenase iron-sulfur subunit